jgi:hypothetical protein
VTRPARYAAAGGLGVVLVVLGIVAVQAVVVG